jgi:hypothetical protein
MTSRIIQGILEAINEFELGEIDIDVLQSRLEAAAAALDNSEQEILAALKDLDSDLERIRFTMRAADQPSAARSRLARLKELM